jgi:coproporphyrinogen III oxidase
VFKRISANPALERKFLFVVFNLVFGRIFVFSTVGTVSSFLLQLPAKLIIGAIVEKFTAV